MIVNVKWVVAFLFISLAGCPRPDPEDPEAEGEGEGEGESGGTRCDADRSVGRECTNIYDDARCPVDYPFGGRCPLNRLLCTWCFPDGGSISLWCEQDVENPVWLRPGSCIEVDDF